MTPGNEHLLHHMEVFLCVPDDKDANFPIWSGKSNFTIIKDIDKNTYNGILLPKLF